jgi:hypothetical protein
MGHQPVEANLASRAIEMAAPEVSDAKNATTGRWEDERIASESRNLLDEDFCKERRHRYGPGLMCLRRAEYRLPIDLRHGFGDLQPPTHRVDATDPERRGLSIAGVLGSD